MSRLLLSSSSAALALMATGVAAQVQGEVGRYSDVIIENSVLEPEKIEVSDDDELAGLIRAPEGFSVEVFARDLVNPRMLAVSDAGTLYATRRDVGDVIMLKDEDGDGAADGAVTVASRPGMHGIAFDGTRVFLVTVNDVYVADVNEDGGFGALQRIIDDLPDAGQHPNRTIAIGPDDMLYISVGSTCNACDESNPENATMLRAGKDGTQRTIFATGLRNTIGFDWEPESGALWGMDHGIDWLGDEEQIEELNRIEQGEQYGWPYVYGASELNPQDNPPEGITLEQWAEMSVEPELGYTAHSAPMQMAFYDGATFPEEYRGDAFIAMRGSWNRRPPSGYEVIRVRFEDGGPTAIEPFLEGFLIEQEDGGFGYLGRLAGIAVGPDGALYASDDSNGVIYRVTHSASPAPAPGESATASTPDTVPEPRTSELEISLVEPNTDAAVEVRSEFSAGERIPLQYAADGDNASPPLSWSEGPEGTQSFAVIMSDPEAARPKPFVHWVVYDIPAGMTSLREGLPTSPTLPDVERMKQGANDRGSIGYFGPKPPAGDPAHDYHVQVFALDVPELEIDPGSTRDELLAAMQGHVLATGELVGTFQTASPE